MGNVGGTSLQVTCVNVFQYFSRAVASDTAYKAFVVVITVIYILVLISI